MIDVFVQGPAFYDGRAVFYNYVSSDAFLTFMFDFGRDCVAPRTAATCV